MITKEQIKHTAELAKLKITAEEASRYSKELSAVVGYIDRLKGVDTSGLEPTAQVTGLVNRWRKDKAKAWNKNEVDEILSQAKTETGQKAEINRILEVEDFEEEEVCSPFSFVV